MPVPPPNHAGAETRGPDRRCLDRLGRRRVLPRHAACVLFAQGPGASGAVTPTKRREGREVFTLLVGGPRLSVGGWRDARLRSPAACGLRSHRGHVRAARSRPHALQMAARRRTLTGFLWEDASFPREEASGRLAGGWREVRSDDGSGRTHHLEAPTPEVRLGDGLSLVDGLRDSES